MVRLKECLVEQIKTAYCAEYKQLKLLPLMIQKASNDNFRDVLEINLAQTVAQVYRLERAAQELLIKPGGGRCRTMEILIHDSLTLIQKCPRPMIDTMLISIARRIEHYEIAAYSSMRNIARRFGFTQVLSLFRENLAEEIEADKRLSMVASKNVYPSFRPLCPAVGG